MTINKLFIVKMVSIEYIKAFVINYVWNDFVKIFIKSRTHTINIRKREQLNKSFQFISQY